MKTDREIIETYSDFFTFKDDRTKSNMRYGFCCDEGWYPLIVETLDILDESEYAKYIEIVQIKEKFGSLRIYFRIREEFELKYTDNIFKKIYYKLIGFSLDAKRAAVWKELHEISAEASRKSAHTCEKCGKHPAQKAYSEYWIKTVCRDCCNTFDNFTYDSTKQ